MPNAVCLTMLDRNAAAATVLLSIIFVLTVIITGNAVTPPRLGGLTPLLIMTLMIWYLILLIVNRNGIIAGVAAIFKLRRQTEFVRGSSLWATIVAYAIVFLTGIIIIWMGIPQQILQTIQGFVITFGARSSSSSVPPSPIESFVPTSAVIYFGGFLLAAIFVLSCILLIAGMRLAASSGRIRVDDSRLELEEEAREVVEQTITSLKAEREIEYHEIILQCYKRMCKILSRAGIEVGPSETAREFAQSVSTKLHAGDKAISGLTFLFEEARYSNHRISEEKRKLALDCLSSLQLALSTNVGKAA